MRLTSLRARLGELGANCVEHSHRSLTEHLDGTARLLQAWGCQAYVCEAGLFHSIYGTNAFTFSCVDRQDRERVRSIVGTRAEELVYLFGTSCRPHGLLQAATTGHLVNRLSNEQMPVTRECVQDLLEIECANLIEQHCGHQFLAEVVLAVARSEVLLKPRVVAAVREFLEHISGPVAHSLPIQGAVMQATATSWAAEPDAEQFAQRGYVVARNLLSRRMMDIALRYYLSYLKYDGYYSVSDSTRALNRYADALGEALIPEIQPQIEQKIGKKLLATYSFARIYTTDSILTPHVDRGACEISATVTVGFKSSSLWPIFVQQGGNDIAVELDVGDALIYRGMDLPHWREPLQSGFWCQLFFHFVDAEGSMTEHQFDGRGRLGPYLATEDA